MNVIAIAGLRRTQNKARDSSAATIEFKATAKLVEISAERKIKNEGNEKQQPSGRDEFPSGLAEDRLKAPLQLGKDTRVNFIGNGSPEFLVQAFSFGDGEIGISQVALS